ncbi:putative FtsW-like protein [Flavobacteriaceae bacterium UJ101]|nr:putative FtsW-like protein [Flavobacteriaceae bacterium UJ101]
MKTFLNNIKGDRYLWAFILLLAIFSFLPVYSAGEISPLKHLVFLIIGFIIIYFTHYVEYKYFGGIAVLALPVVIILLLLTLMQGTTMGGANASRWLRIPGLGIGFQTSTLASIILMMYVARYLVKIKDKKITFKETLLPLITPILIIVGLIFPANGSTALLVFGMVSILLFIGGYPIKYLAIVIGSMIALAALFITLAYTFPDAFPNRVETWKNRIERFVDHDKDIAEDYQVYIAKSAIVNGGLIGLPKPGQSHFKYKLPQASSDFIYALIVEEYSAAGGILLIFLYILILWRILVNTTKIHTFFGTLLILAVGLPILFQAFSNMAVAVNLIPVTGQTLPMVSAGGTSIWVTCFAFGVILSVSRAIKSKEELQNERIIRNEFDQIA